MSESGEDRRRSSRYSPARAEVVVGWHGPQGFQTISATLVNIGLGGVALRDDGRLSGVRSAWTKLNGDDPAGWAPLVVEGEGVDADGNRVVRFRFSEECPYDYYRAAVFGFSDGSETQVHAPETDADAPDEAAPLSAFPNPSAARQPSAAPEAEGFKAVFTRVHRFGWAGWRKVPPLDPRAVAAPREPSDHQLVNEDLPIAGEDD